MAIELVYGDTMTGKSQGIERVARQIIEKSGKKARIYIGDGGVETYNAHGLVDDGMIETFDYSSLEFPLTIVKLIGDLYWPKDWRDPSTKLVPPPANLFDQYGLIVVEGGQVMGQYIMSDLKGGLGWHAANETGFGGVKDENDELHYEDDIKGYEGYGLHGTLSGKHSYVAQKKILSVLKATKKFPGLVIWTSHPTEAPDKTEGGTSDQYGKISGMKIIGPDFGGKAPASLIGKEFGNMLHFDTVTIPKKETDELTKKQVTTESREFRVYTRKHHDPEGKVPTVYLAGNRGAVPEMIKDYYVSKEPGDAILQFYQAMSDARAKSREQKG